MTLRAEVQAAFAKGGPIARAFGNYEPRPSQVDMALAVADAISNRTTLLCEAGTGTGKTLAYAVPAILAEQKVMISTATKNLQDQIFMRDLPRLQAALGRKLKVVCLKGRHNYLCLHRLTRAKAQPNLRFGGALEPLTLIDKWSQQTQSGDRAELKELPDDFAPWRELDARSDICLGSRCPVYDECFVVRQRLAAHQADVLVINHHLYFADLSLRARNNEMIGSLLPKVDVTVFDEAHALSQVATEHLGATLSETQLQYLCRDVLDVPDPGATRTPVLEVQKAAAALFHQLPTERDRKPFEAEALEEQAVELNDALLHLAKALGASEEATAPAYADRARRLAGDTRFLFALEPRAGEYARLVEERAQNRAVRALPLSVAETIASHVFTDAGATILTSATLSIAGSFETIRQRLGIPTAEERIFASPFSYPEQALVYVPTDFPEPNADAFAGALSDLLVCLCEASQGGAFLLFTSLKMMHLQARVMRERLSLNVMVQGEAPKAALLERFAQDGSAVLLASQSFWEGVDVPGHALRLVAIDKLPFGSPSDPLLAARLKQAEANGGRGFDKYQLPDAILSLCQGFGRLIRTRSDSGVVALCDVRIRSRAYGRKFLRALPPAPVTASLDRVRAFYAGLPASVPSPDLRSPAPASVPSLDLRSPAPASGRGMG